MKNAIHSAIRHSVLATALLAPLPSAVFAETGAVVQPACPAFEDERGWFISHPAPRSLPDEAFEDQDGGRFRFSDLQGKPLLVHFWGSWCPPCLKELPSINKLQGLLWQEGLLVLPLSRDSGGPEKVRETYDKLEIGLLPLFTDRLGMLSYQAGVSSVPVTLYVNRDAKEIGRLYGSVDWASPAMMEHVRSCLLTGPVVAPAF